MLPPGCATLRASFMRTGELPAYLLDTCLWRVLLCLDHIGC